MNALMTYQCPWQAPSTSSSPQVLIFSTLLLLLLFFGLPASRLLLYGLFFSTQRFGILLFLLLHYICYIDWILDSFLGFLRGESYDWRKNMLRKELLRISNFGSSNLAVNPHWAVFQDETRSVYVYIFYMGSHEYRHLCVECSFGLL